MVDVGSASASSSGSNQNNSNPGEEDKKDERMFECNICLDTAKDAVVSMCGHLFCWPCLHQWLETRPARQMCPVCKAAISKEKVIPLYGRGSSKQEDPRNKAPPRPAGQRSEPEANTTEEGQWWVSEEESANESANESGSPDFVVDSEDSDAIFYRDWVLDNSHAGIEYLLDVLRADSDDTDDTSLPWAESTDVDFSVDNSTVDSDDADTMFEDDGVDVVSLDEWHTAIVGGLDIDSSDSVSEVSNASESSTDNVDTELSDSDL